MRVPLRFCAALLAAVFLADEASAESPLQPVTDRTVLPVEIRDLPMVGVLHVWGGGLPITGVAHGCLPWHGPTASSAELPTVWVWEPGEKSAVVAKTERVASRGDGLLAVVDLAFPTTVKPGPNVRCVFVGGAKPATPPVEYSAKLDPLKRRDLLQVKLTDARDQEYVANLFEKHVAVRRAGPHERMDEFFGVMRPTKPGPNALPQLLRFHTFAKAHTGSQQLDIRILVENSCSEKPASDIRFTSLQFALPENAFVDEWLNPGVDVHIVRRLSGVVDGRRIVTMPRLTESFPSGAFFDCELNTYRVNLYVEKSRHASWDIPHFVAVPGRDDKGNATWSWNSLAAFGPSWIGVPQGDAPREQMAAALAEEFHGFPKISPLMKNIDGLWVHGDVHGDAPSGEDIAFASPLAVRWIQSGGAWQAKEMLDREFRASLHRQRFGFWKPDGSLWTLLDRFVGDKEKLEGYTPGLNIFSGRPHPEPSCYKFERDVVERSPAWIALQKASIGKAEKHREELLKYTNYDDEHLCRFTQRLFALVWLCNDPVAKKILEAQASISLAAANPFPTSANGDVVSGTQAELRQQAKLKPHAGSYHLARGMGWNAQAICGGLAITENPALKKLGDRWLHDFCENLAAAQLPTGGVHRADGDEKVNLDLDNDGRIAPNEREVAVDHASIYMQGIFRFAGCRSVRFALDPKRQAKELSTLLDSCRKLDRYFVTLAWDESVDLPGWNMAVSSQADRAKVVTQKIRGGVWGGSASSAFYFDDILAEAHELDPGGPYLDFIARMHRGDRRLDRAGPNSTHAAWVLDRTAPRR